MNLLKFLQQKKECKHSKVSANDDLCYCPDCGELIENRWYLVRCKCCGIKLKAIYKNNKIIAEEKYCHNCGSNNFEAERIPNINCIDINYAVLVKTAISTAIETQTQSWFENKNLDIKLLTQT